MKKSLSTFCLIASVLVNAAIAGCGKNSSSTVPAKGSSSAIPTKELSRESIEYLRALANLKERTVDPKEFEITPKALEVINRIAKEKDAGPIWWVRIRFVADDFWGLVPDMTISQQPPAPDEASFQATGIGIKYLREDYPLIQGGQIKWAVKYVHEGLDLGSPNQTPENKKIAELRQSDGRIEKLTEQLLANPNDALKYCFRARDWKKKSDNAKALSDYNAAVRLQPEDAFFLFERGELHCKLLSFEAGIQDLSKAVESLHFDPMIWRSEDEWEGRLAEWSSDLAWIFATCPDERFRNAAKSVELATKACEFTKWKSERSIRTLAAAFAEKRDFEMAVKWQEDACVRVSKEKRAKQEAILKEYQAGKPHREDFSKWESATF